MLLKEEHATLSAHVPVALRRELAEHARESDRTLSGEVRRALDFYVRHEYRGDCDKRTSGAELAR